MQRIVDANGRMLGWCRKCSGNCVTDNSTNGRRASSMGEVENTREEDASREKNLKD